MLHTVKQLLLAEGIALCAPLTLSACKIHKPYLLERAGIPNGTAFLFAVPYYTTKCEDPARNISAYAVARDYHRFFADLFQKILPQLQAAFPAYRFAGFSDHSPLLEVDAAAKAGLGVLGCNGLLLTRAYSSFVFLGEIVTDAVLEAPAHPIEYCSRCGACRRHCPAALQAQDCLSALSQKKGELTQAQCDALLAGGSVWGCDACQLLCPVTAQAKNAGTLYSSIPYFNENTRPHLTASDVRDMSDEEFEQRAYGWRPRAVLLRNLTLFEKGE